MSIPQRLRPAVPIAIGAVLCVLGACGPTPPTPEPTTTSAVASPEGPLLTPSPANPNAKVGGFAGALPEFLRELPPDAEVLLSTAEPDDKAGTVRVSLNLTSPQDAKKLAAHYRKLITGAGFKEVDPSAEVPKNALQLSFANEGGDQFLSVAIANANDVRTVSIGGVVEADGPS